MLDSALDDLVLNASVAVDFTNGTRTTLVRGTMRPFQVHLLGGNSSTLRPYSSMARRSKAAVAGSVLAFQAEVSDVKLGTLIQFLQPLQKWLSPEGDGFYVKAVFNPPGLEAGYGFAADVIPLGAILFVNVALKVSALLPFTDAPAIFTFSFASPEREFMIVAPPYGGGGHLVLVANSGRIVKFRFGLCFGAIIPIEFGPLRATGRVVAGIYIIQSGESRTIGAFVEAAGEGHIACFGISVCLRVGLEKIKMSSSATATSLSSSVWASRRLRSASARLHRQQQ